MYVLPWGVVVVVWGSTLVVVCGVYSISFYIYTSVSIHSALGVVVADRYLLLLHLPLN